MISYILVYEFASGLHLFSVKSETDIDSLIASVLSAINSFTNTVFNLTGERIDLIVMGNYCIQQFVLFDDLDIDIIFAYDKNEHPFIHELYQIIKGILSQFKPLFAIRNGDRDKFKIPRQVIADYLEYWKHEKRVDGISVEGII